MLHFTTVLANYIFDDFWNCSILVKIYRNIWKGGDPSHLSLHTANVPNATTPRAWSADPCDL